MLEWTIMRLNLLTLERHCRGYKVHSDNEFFRYVFSAYLLSCLFMYFRWALGTHKVR